MSALQRPGKNSPDTTRDDAPPDIDAYAIDIPDAFIEGFEGETVAEKLRHAEQYDPGNDDGPSCVRCGGRRLSPKGNGTQSTRKAGEYVCETCGTHQSNPEHPEIADIEFADGQTQLGEWSQ